MEKDTISGLLALAQATALILVFLITDKMRKNFKPKWTYILFFLFCLIIGYFAISARLGAEEYQFEQYIETITENNKREYIPKNFEEDVALINEGYLAKQSAEFFEKKIKFHKTQAQAAFKKANDMCKFLPEDKKKLHILCLRQLFKRQSV
jgi:hypothetical protein